MAVTREYTRCVRMCEKGPKTLYEFHWWLLKALLFPGFVDKSDNSVELCVVNMISLCGEHYLLSNEYSSCGNVAPAANTCPAAKSPPHRQNIQTYNLYIIILLSDETVSPNLDETELHVLYYNVKID